MSTTTRPPAGMPAHLWELAKRDVDGLLPDRLRRAPDGSRTAPPAVRAVARRVATLAAVSGAAAAIWSFADDPEVALAATTSDVPDAPASGGLDPAPTVPGGHAPFGHVGSHAEGGAGGPGVASGLGSSWNVTTDDGSGHASVMTVQLFQDVVVVENADGTFTVVAEQVVRIVDPDGHEHVFHDHYETVVPDPPGQETDLTVHEDGHVRLVENPDGSFTPHVDTSVTITAGADGDGHDEVSIDQDESVSITDHDPHHGDTVRTDLSETASSTSHDTGDEATSTIRQDESVGPGERRADSATSTPAPPSSAATPLTATSASATTAAVSTVAPEAVRLDPSPQETWRVDDAPIGDGHGTDVPADGHGGVEPAFTGGHDPAAAQLDTEPATTGPDAPADDTSPDAPGHATDAFDDLPDHGHDDDHLDVGRDPHGDHPHDTHDTHDGHDVGGAHDGDAADPVALG